MPLKRHIKQRIIIKVADYTKNSKKIVLKETMIWQTHTTKRADLMRHSRSIRDQKEKVLMSTIDCII